MFSWSNKWELASFGQNKTPVELAQKFLADLHCKFVMQHQNKKTSSADRTFLTDIMEISFTDWIENSIADIGSEIAATDIF